MRFLIQEAKDTESLLKKDAGNVEHNISTFNNSTICESEEDSIELADLDNYTKQYEKLWGYVHVAFAKFLENLPDEMEKETGLELNRGVTDAFLKNFNDMTYTITDNLFDEYYTGKKSVTEDLDFEDPYKELLDDCAEYVRENGQNIWIEDAYTTDGGFAFLVDGDWKHDHSRLNHLIERFFADTNYKISIQEETTESDGSDNYKAIHYVTVDDSLIEDFSLTEDFSGPVLINHFEGLLSQEDIEKIEVFLDSCDAEIYYNDEDSRYIIRDTSDDFGPYTLSELLEDITYTLSQWNEIDSEG